MCQRTFLLLTLVLTMLLTSACTQPTTEDSDAVPPALKEVFEGDFFVGAALNPSQFSEQDERGAALVKKHFNTITPENVMKWENLHPAPGTYDFEAADRFVAFGEENDMFIVGHTLVWHNQTPEWVFEDDTGTPASRDTLLARMRDHIHTVVGRYEGRVDGWDVVNEALNEDGTLRSSPWLEIIGPEYLAKAYQFAQEADPEAELYYNDYSLANAPKRQGAVELVRGLQAQDIPVTGIGMQGHWEMNWPTRAQVDSTIAAFAGLGVDVMITELDIDVLPEPVQQQEADATRDAVLLDALNPYPEALPDSVQQALARRYANLFEVFLDHRGALSRVTFWGVTDGDSWLNYWPVEGRTNYPLLFNRRYEPKPAFEAVVETARQ